MILILRGGCWERGRQFFSEGGCSFLIKNKLKFEIFDDKKLYKTKTFVSVITKSLNIIYNI